MKNVHEVTVSWKWQRGGLRFNDTYHVRASTLDRAITKAERIAKKDALKRNDGMPIYGLRAKAGSFLCVLDD